MMRNYQITIADEGTWNDQEFDTHLFDSGNGFHTFHNSVTGRELNIRGDRLLWVDSEEILPIAPDRSGDVPG